jgi:hypothetical protein
MKQVKILILLILLLTVFSSQSFSNEVAFFNTDFFKENQEYYGTTQIKEAIYHSRTIIKRDNSNIILTSDEGPDQKIVVMKNDFTPVKAFIKNDNEITAEIIYQTNEIVMKDKDKIVKTIRIKPGQTYLQRESLELVLRGYNFTSGQKLNFNLISLDLDCYYMELSLVGKERVQTKKGDLTCYKLLMMPGGAGKLFASKYQNYYYFTDEPPHYFIKYYNDFIPLATEVETIPGL